MSKKIINNLQIFNVCVVDNRISLRTLNKIYNYEKSKIIDQETVFECFGVTPKTRRIVKALKEIDTTKISIYALYAIGINQLIINLLKTKFTYLNEIESKRNDFLLLHFNSKTNKKIWDFVIYSKNVFAEFSTTSNIGDVENKILKLLNKNQQPISKTQLFNYFAADKISRKIIFNSMENLRKNKLIKITFRGLEIPKQKIDNYISSQNISNFPVLHLYLTSDKKMNSDDWRKIQKEITYFPIFDQEHEYFNFIKNNNLSVLLLNELGFSDTTLIKYVRIKYSLPRENDDIVYVLKNKLQNSNIGRIVQEKYNIVFVKGGIIKNKFITLFDFFIELNKIQRFEKAKIFIMFNIFLKQHNVKLKIEQKDYTLYLRKIENSHKYLNCGYGNYLTYRSKKINTYLIGKMREYLNTFEGYGSVLWFFDKNKDLCLKSGINDKYELFIVMKTLFQNEFKESIDFVRSPTICEKNINRVAFIERQLSGCGSIKSIDFAKYISDKCGIDVKTLYASNDFQSVAKKYRGADQKLNYDNSFTLSINEKTAINNFIKNKIIFCENSINKYLLNCGIKLDTQNIKFALSKFGFNFRKDTFYSSKFDSLLDAIETFLKKFDTTFNYKKINNYLGEWAVTDRSSPAIQNILILEISEQNAIEPIYLNVNSIISSSELLNFRNELIDKILEPNKIYVFDDLVKQTHFQIFIQKHKKISEFISAFGNRVLINILKSSAEVTFLSKSSTNKFVFGVGEMVTIKRLILIILEKELVIDRAELHTILQEKYGVKYEKGTKDRLHYEMYSKSYFEELGLFFEEKSNKIFYKEDIYNEQLENYLKRGN